MKMFAFLGVMHICICICFPFFLLILFCVCVLCEWKKKAKHALHMLRAHPPDSVAVYVREWFFPQFVRLAVDDRVLVVVDSWTVTLACYGRHCHYDYYVIHFYGDLHANFTQSSWEHYSRAFIISFWCLFNFFVVAKIAMWSFHEAKVETHLSTYFWL